MSGFAALLLVASGAIALECSLESCTLNSSEIVSGLWNSSIGVDETGLRQRAWLSGPQERNASIAFDGLVEFRINTTIGLSPIQTENPFEIDILVTTRLANGSMVTGSNAFNNSWFNVTVCAPSNASTEQMDDCGVACTFCIMPDTCFGLKRYDLPNSAANDEADRWQCLESAQPWWSTDNAVRCIDLIHVLSPPLPVNRVCTQLQLPLMSIRVAIFDNSSALDTLQRANMSTPEPTTPSNNLVVIVVGLVALVFCVSMVVTAMFVIYKRKKNTMKPKHLVKLVGEDGVVVYIDADLHNSDAVRRDEAAAAAAAAAAANAAASTANGTNASNGVITANGVSGGPSVRSPSGSSAAAPATNASVDERSSERKRREQSSTTKPHHSPSSSSRRSSRRSQDRMLALAVVDDTWLIPYASLTMRHHLGAGAFGDVSLAEMADGTRVAVKRLLPPENNTLQTPAQAAEAFLKESRLMQQLPSHRNVIKLIGVCIEPLCIITEYCEGGSLDRWVRKHVPALKQVLVMSIDVAHGLQHLHQHNIIHRDLAARNLLMTADNVIRVADFGLARDTNKDGYQTRAEQGPLKWMAPESIEKQRYSRASDMWAYGVTVWELFARSLPWPDMSPTQACVAVITKNLRLERPENCPPEVYEFVQACWRIDPADRIKVDELISGFSVRLADLLRSEDSADEDEEEDEEEEKKENDNDNDDDDDEESKNNDHLPTITTPENNNSAADDES